MHAACGKNSDPVVLYPTISFFVQEGIGVSPFSNQVAVRPRTNDRPGDRVSGSIRVFLALALAIVLIVLPAAGSDAALIEQPAGTGPDIVEVSFYIIDFKRVDVEAGTFGVDFYLTLTSDTSVTIDDFELMNGMISSITLVRDTPQRKEYRIVAVLSNEPDLSRYPFDRHTLSLWIEPQQKNEQQMVLTIDSATSGIYAYANVPGWTLTGTRSAVVNATYLPGEVPYSRAVFDCGIERDAASTILKFLLPLMLIVIISLSSLLMKTTSRLGLNASMFLATVLIHWRVADSIPLVAYATFLDLFMIITYAMLVMVLLTAILTLKFTESGDTARVDQINYWSIRVIPPVTITLYSLLFISLLI